METKQSTGRRTRPLTVVIADDITTTHPGQSLDAVIAEVLEGFAVRRSAFLARNPDEQAYVDSEDDHTIWSGPKLLATVRAAPGAKPEVVRLDQVRPGVGLSEDDIDAHFLPWDVTDRAIGRWNEAVRERDEAFKAAEGHEGLEKWTDQTTIAAAESERRLVRAILAWSPDFEGPRTREPSKWPWPARGVLSCGKLYLAITNPDREGEHGGDHVNMTRVVVIEMSNVVDANDCPDFMAAGEAPEVATGKVVEPSRGARA